ncbi:hypothetical protein HOLleu_21633 [Holothuria leucospilota]|uniref:SRCR domain-containing protein n=1 Tax=Holothuria leucospilota TaxID=206669 RepID=A0A9Q1BXX5_HOLLE|nr:hypothetical protein HOLleu_21633 [Holothuria leucospilota]
MQFLSTGDGLQGILLAEGLSHSSGRVEIMYSGSLITVCDVGWDLNDASVVCRQLGFSSAVNIYGGGTFGEGFGHIWANVQCSGNELSVSEYHSYLWYSHLCSHFNDAGVLCKANVTQDIRLVEGITNSSGRVEVFFNGEWGTVCNFGWDSVDADVVCRQLGYPSAIETYKNTSIGDGSGFVWLTNVICNGSESSLLDCKHEKFGQRECTHEEDVGVLCKVETENDMQNIRLVNGLSNSSGRIEVFFNGEWGTVCGDNWTIVNSYVVCRQLGYPAAVVTYTNAFFSGGSGIIWLRNVRCSGSESDLLECKHQKLGQPECNHRQDVGVLCSETVVQAVRLVDGFSNSSGRIEVRFHGEWGTMCDDRWTLNNSDVVCRQLGFAAADVTFTKSFFGKGPGFVWSTNVHCKGNESSLLECKHWSRIEEKNCNQGNEVGVQCKGKRNRFGYVLSVFRIITYVF